MSKYDDELNQEWNPIIVQLKTFLRIEFGAIIQKYYPEKYERLRAYGPAERSREVCNLVDKLGESAITFSVFISSIAEFMTFIQNVNIGKYCISFRNAFNNTSNAAELCTKIQQLAYVFPEFNQASEHAAQIQKLIDLNIERQAIFLKDKFSDFIASNSTYNPMNLIGDERLGLEQFMSELSNVNQRKNEEIAKLSSDEKIYFLMNGEIQTLSRSSALQNIKKFTDELLVNENHEIKKLFVKTYFKSFDKDYDNLVLD